MYGYESEITRFLKDLHQKKPHLESEQQKGRSLLWDRAQDADAAREFRAARVPQQPYVYQTRG
jgi:hypothetical protein